MLEQGVGDLYIVVEGLLSFARSKRREEAFWGLGGGIAGGSHTFTQHALKIPHRFQVLERQRLLWP